MMAWNRIEFHARSADLDPGLQAQIADPLWLLARQWQFGEFQGEDAASPVAVDVGMTVATTSGVRGIAATAEDFSSLPTAPLEAVVESEEVINGPARLRLEAEAAHHFFQILDRSIAHPAIRAAIRTNYPLAATMPGPASLPPRRQRALEILVRSAFEANRFYAHSEPASSGGAPVVPPSLGLGSGQTKAVRSALVIWRPWFAARFLHVPGERWRTDRMEYAVELAAKTPTDTVAASAPSYSDGQLEWSDFDLKPGASVPPGLTLDEATTLDRTLLPQPVRYRGMPASRFWEFEDGRVYLGDINAGPTDLIRMMLVEFALLGADDWFQVPIDLPIGSLTRIESFQVTNTFGEVTTVAPAVEVDGADPPWRMFALAGDPALAQGDSSPWLFLVPSLAKSLESTPIEEVAFARDEMANLAWGIERVVEGESGDPVDRFQRWLATRLSDVPGSTEAISYRVSTRVPDHWYPFVPVQDPNNQSIRLRRGRLLRNHDVAPLPPMGQILDPDNDVRMFEEEIPRSGMSVTRSWQWARWHDGSTHLWVGRQKRLARPARASNLKFDRLEDPEPGG